MKISGVDIRPGNILEYESGIWKVAKIQHTQPGKGGAYMQVEMKNLQDGRKTNVRFRSADTVERGAYVCELPGSADGKAGIEQPDRALTIQSASRYSSPQGSGTYLRRGDTLTLTSGPREGERYAVISTGFLRRIEDGKPGRLRCVRQG